jgi:hypothetical protein
VTAAHHWRKAEEYASLAGDTEGAEGEYLVNLARLHMSLAEALERMVARREDSGFYREPVDEDMAGPPRPGDIWVGHDGAKWLVEFSGRLAELHDPEAPRMTGTFAEIVDLRGYLRLEHRTRLPIDDVFDMECPF